MKRVNNLYQKICDIENIKKAILKASLGKRNRCDVKKVLSNMEYYSNAIQTILEKELYRPTKNRTLIINERTKTREITMPRFFPDQIIHWALMIVLEPIIMKGMYYYNCGNIPKRGGKLGKQYIEGILNKDKKVKYCLKMDIKKFYPTINIKILNKLFERKIKDTKTLNLIKLILGNGEKGIPLGYYTSQWFSNFYLEGLDHFIKEKLKARYYVRYVDDMVIIDTNKRKLHKIRLEIQKYLNEKLDLELKNNYQVFPLKYRCIDFLGFKFYKNGKTKLRKHIFLKINRLVSKIKRKNYCSLKNARSLISLIGWLKQTISYKFYSEKIKPIIKIGTLKRIIQDNTKR